MVTSAPVRPRRRVCIVMVRRYPATRSRSSRPPALRCSDGPAWRGGARWLDAAYVAGEVRARRPDYAALLIVAEGLRPGPSDEASDALLAAAENRARKRLGGSRPEELPEVAEWRGAFRAFGAKPQRTRPSVEALLRRVD